MIGPGATSTTPICFPSTISSISLNSAHSNYFPRKFVHPLPLSSKKHPSCLSTTLHSNKFRIHFSVEASSSVGSAEYTEEPATNVKFQKTLSLPGYREKVFTIIGVKVYAAALYINNSILSRFNEIQEASLFNLVFWAPMEKSLQIVLIRDLDGKTFWDALNDGISPRIKTPTCGDNSTPSTFRSTFEGRPLKKGTLVFLTLPDTSNMLVSISMDGLPTMVDATIESGNVSSALYDVFFGDSPVSPTLKASVAEGLATILK